jgi:adenine specific DNA methylase Mod
MRNKLYCGDNLDVLRHCVADESVDLVYLDPPFKKYEVYNLLFKEKDGSKSKSQMLAFEDAWEWNMEAERNYASVVEGHGKLSQVMVQFRTLLGDSDMLAYLSMMAPRLVELRRVLRQSGSIYLHCDPTASHYLKILMDAVFGPQFFRNEIVWKRAETVKGNFGQGSKFFDRNTDSILFYAKSEQQFFKAQFSPYSEGYIKGFYKFVERETGRRYQLISMTGPGGDAKGNPRYEVMGVARYWRYSKDKMQELIKAGLVVQTNPGTVPRRKLYLDSGRGVSVQSLWDDIPALHANATERLGYPTQKPQSLLERIISASSNEDEVVLDAFCGCGTAIEAAIKLKRRWIGIDITVQAMRVTRNERLPKLPDELVDYDVMYRPCDITAAEAFAAEQPFAFQDWAVEKLDGVPSRHRSGDRGIDGRLYFKEEGTGPLREIVVSVKGGKLKAPFVRELQGAVARERAPMGVLIALNEPSKQMIRDAASSGFYTCALGSYPKIQIITIKDMLSDVHFELPPIQRMDDVRKRTMAVAAASQIPLPGIVG